MYTLKAAYGVATALGSPWQDMNVTQLEVIKMNQLYSLYRQLYLTLESPALAEPIYVDFDIFKLAHVNSIETLKDTLSSLSNATLQTIAEIPRYKAARAKYQDGFRAGYKIECTRPLSPSSAVVAQDEKTELRIWRKNTDMRKFQHSCMVSVNGFWHMTDTDAEFVYVIGGGKSLLKSRQNQLGLLSFEDIGKIAHHPLINELIFKLDQDDLYSRRTYFDLTGFNTAGKTVIFVIGGYIYLPGQSTLREYNDDVYMINFEHLPMLERFMESARYLDFSSMGMSTYPTDPTQINKQEFLSDEFFLRYMLTEQSFFVVLDTPQIYSMRHYLRHNSYPGIYTMFKKPEYPLFNSNGKTAEYWSYEEEGHWILNVHDSFWYNRQFMTVPKSEIISLTEANMPYRTFYNSNGYLLEIGADVKIT